MSDPINLNVLMVEDSEDDALLVLRELRRGGFTVICQRVETAEALRTALPSRPWDVLISDYRLPRFNAAAALAIVQQSQPNLPFIVVSGTIGEACAVELMKAGAHDYLMKDSLTRLSEAVRREVREAQIRSERLQAAIDLDQMKERLQLAIEGSGIGLWDWSVQTGALALNDRWAEMIGYTLEELEPISVETWRQHTHPEDWQEAIITLEDHFRRRTQVYECELRMRHKLGLWVWVLARGRVVEWDAAGTPLRMTGTHLDISDRKLAELRLELQNRILQRIAKAEPLPDILNALVLATEEQLEDSLCSILLCNRDGQLHHGAAPHLPPSYNQAIEGMSTGEGEGSCGTAVFRQKPVIVCDIATDQLWENYRDLALAHGLRACWSVPVIASDASVLATFAVYYHDVHSPQERELEIIALVANITKIAIEREYATQALERLNRELEDRVAQRTAALQRSENRLREAQQVAHLGSWELDVKTREIAWSAEIFSIFGRAPDEAEPSYEQLLYYFPAHEWVRFDHLIDQAIHDGKPYTTDLQIIRADASPGYIFVKAELIRNPAGQVTRLFGIMMDISDRKAIQEALQRSEERARATLLALPDLVFRVNRDGQYVDFMASPQPGNLVNLKSAIGKSIFEALPRGLSAAQIETKYHVLQQVLATQTVQIYEQQVGNADHLRYEEVRVAPCGNDEVVFFIRDISDRKQAEQTIRQQAERETLLREITQRIRQSLDLQTIFDTACREIRSVIQADRVGIFKFYPEANFDDGEFVAESVVDGFPSVVAIRVHDHCFGENYSSLYSQGRYYVADDIYHNGIAPCHTDILAQFQVQANLVMPLLCGNLLWGLLCVHQCATIRHWQQGEIDFTQQIANQLAIAIQQANLYEQIQSELLVRQQAEARIALQLRRQQTLGAIAQHIRESLDINEILATVTQQVKDLMHGDRVIVFRLFPDGRSQIVEEAVSGEFAALKDSHWDDEVWSQEILDCYWRGEPRIVPDVMNDVWTRCLVEYCIAGQIQSKIVAPILQDVRDRETHRWVAPWESNKLWGVLVVHACREKRLWQESEAQLLHQIANQLAIAIQQASLFEQLQQELAERQQAETKLTESNQQLAISNQELARATRLKDEFLANMSHELRTPLNAILGMTEGLQEGVFGAVNTQQIKALQTVESSGTHLLELINDILDVAKIESGQMDLLCTPTSVSHLCQSSLTFIKQQALQKRIQLQVHLDPHLPNLMVDERRVRQVLINLLNNAVKFTPEGGRILLQVRSQEEAGGGPEADGRGQELGNCWDTGSWILFSVIDTGIGISPENIKKLFQPFIQVDSALNRQYTGTGLGLALVKRIVEMHGGRVELSSELGVGSCFTIALPCDRSNPLSPQMSIQANPSFEPSALEPLASPLILLAEDNEANISTISSYLIAKGYRILLAKDGQEAISLTQAYQPDLILMDIQMPGMDGLEAMQRIRIELKLADIPIIALTALAMAGDQEKCLAAGASDYLAKPVKLKQLATVIQQYLAPPKYIT